MKYLPVKTDSKLFLYVLTIIVFTIFIIYLIAFQAVLGNMTEYPVILDKRLAEELRSLSKKTDDFQTITGGTLGAEDFYNGNVLEIIIGKLF